MDIKRVEGTALNESILNSQPTELSQQAQELSIAIQSTVSQALMGALSDELSKQGFIQATVEDVSQGRIKLMLNNGVEINVDSQISMDVKKNDVLRLMISSLNPLVLKIMDLKSQTPSISTLKQAMDNPSTAPTLKDLSKDSIENSGLFYEKKLIDFILKAKDFSNIVSDNKYQILQNMISLAKDLKNSPNFQSIPPDIKQAIENISTAHITPKDIQTLTNPKTEEPPKDLSDILNMLLSTEEPPKDLTPYIPKALENISNIEKNYIFNPQKLSYYVSELSNALKEFPPRVKDIFFKSLQNIINTSNTSFKELLKSNPELFLDIVNIDPKTMQDIKNNIMSSVQNYIKNILKDIPQSQEQIPNPVLKNLPQEIKDTIIKTLQSIPYKDINLPQELKNNLFKPLQSLDNTTKDAILNFIEQNISQTQLNKLENIFTSLSPFLKTDNIDKNLPEFISKLSYSLENLPPEIKTSILNAIQDPKTKDIINLASTISNIKDENMKNTIVNVLKNIDSIKQDFAKSISQNPVKVFELTKHLKDEITSIQNNVSFDKKMDEIKSNANMLNNINVAQNFILQNNMFFVNFEEESHKKGFGAFKKEENEYKAFIKLNWEEGFLGSVLSMPKTNHKSLSIKFFTDIEALSKAIESSKEDLENILKEEGLHVSSFEVNLLNQEQFDISVLKTINESGNLNIFT